MATVRIEFVPTCRRCKEAFPSDYAVCPQCGADLILIDSNGNTVGRVEVKE